MGDEVREEAGELERVANDAPESCTESDVEAPLLKPMKKSLSSISWGSLSASGTSLGMKTIGFYGSVVLTVNNITGAGMLTLPQIFQDSGWVAPSLLFMVICITSTLTATFFTDAMARIRGNHSFDRRLEFSCVVEAFMGKIWKRIALVMLVICLYSQILSGIVATAQILDSFIVFVNPQRATYALQFNQEIEFVNWTAPPIPHEQLGVCNRTREIPFEDEGGPGGAVISMGYVLTMLVLIPFSMQNLEDSIASQTVAFVLLLCACAVFIGQFVEEGLRWDRVPAFGGSYSGMFGSIVFNYGFIVMIPSWVNEKRPDVSVNKTMWTSTVVATVIYMSVGVLGAMAYDSISGNFLRSLASHCNPTITRISAFVFASVCVGLSVPVFCIMVRYNLTVGMQCGEAMAYVLSTILPWLVSWLFYRGTAFEQVVSWSGQVNNGPVNFILPLVVSLVALETVCPCLPAPRRERSAEEGEEAPPEEEEKEKEEEAGKGAEGPGGGEEEEGVPRKKTRSPRRLRRTNSRTRVRPLPRQLHAAQPTIAMVTCVLLVLLIVASIILSLVCVGASDDADELQGEPPHGAETMLHLLSRKRFQFC